jgi:hypothetical protein
MPRGVTDADFGAKLYAAVFEKYQEAVSHLPNPITDPYMLRMRLGAVSELVLSPRTILNCFQSNNGVSLADTGANAELAPLTGYGPENAYGLVTDFRRRDKRSAMTFENAQGEGHVIYPFAIADADNKPDNPDFQTIIGWARELTDGREVQTARVLQAFSQAATGAPLLYSGLFPDAPMSEHGNYSFTAKAQPDGKVVVDIVGDPALPVEFREQFTIEPDGACKCTAFDMRRK